MEGDRGGLNDEGVDTLLPCVGDILVVSFSDVEAATGVALPAGVES